MKGADFLKLSLLSSVDGSTRILTSLQTMGLSVTTALTFDDLVSITVPLSDMLIICFDSTNQDVDAPSCLYQILLETDSQSTQIIVQADTADLFPKDIVSDPRVYYHFGGVLSLNFYRVVFDSLLSLSTKKATRRNESVPLALLFGEAPEVLGHTPETIVCKAAGMPDFLNQLYARDIASIIITEDCAREHPFLIDVLKKVFPEKNLIESIQDGWRVTLDYHQQTFSVSDASTINQFLRFADAAYQQTQLQRQLVSSLRSTIAMRESQVVALVETERDHNIKAFTSSLLHEIANMVNSGKQSASAVKKLLGTTSRNPKIDTNLDRVLNQFGNIDHLCHDLRAYAYNRLVSLNIKRTPMSSIYEMVRDLVQHRLPPYRLAFKGDDQFIMCDVVLITTVLRNLIINSLDALRFNDYPDGEILVSTSLDQDTLVIVVNDNGPGISPDYLEQIMEPFVSTKPGGRGLGLSICDRIIQRHRGTLLLQNKVGGCEATIRLPLVLSA